MSNSYSAVYRENKLTKETLVSPETGCWWAKSMVASWIEVDNKDLNMNCFVSFEIAPLGERDDLDTLLCSFPPENVTKEEVYFHWSTVQGWRSVQVNTHGVSCTTLQFDLVVKQWTKVNVSGQLERAFKQLEWQLCLTSLKAKHVCEVFHGWMANEKKKKK